MTIAEVKTMLESISGFSNKVAYWAWPEDDSSAPELPFICYYTPSNNSFGADNKVYYESNNYVVELYTLQKDTANEALIESKLAETGIFYRKTWNYIESEKCFMTQYEIEV